MTRTITLVPDSGLQFWPIHFAIDQIKKVRRWFWEERDGVYEDGTARYILRVLEEDVATGVIRDPQTGRVPPENEIYDISWKNVIEMLSGQWVPLPFFNSFSEKQDDKNAFRKGPANWVRGRLTQLQDSQLHVDIVFDTTLEDGSHDFYNAPSLEDSQRQDYFLFVSNPSSNAWFLNEGWIGDWLLKIQQDLLDNQNQTKPKIEDRPYFCRHYAIYQTFLELLEITGKVPAVHLLDGGKGRLAQPAVEVDMVLDLGNSRSCGLLIENNPGQEASFSNSFPLILQDLSRPHLSYDQPFPSRVEFARANFGSDLLSRRSGRTKAFSWPSPVRVGHEAVHLAGVRIGNEGMTGLSSPKRYLWDTQLSAQTWRYNSRSISSGSRIVDPPVNGPFMAMLSPDGRVLNDQESRNGENITTQPNFPRSLLFTFMLVEILLQARRQINAPQSREERQDKTLTRRLRSVVLTMPPGMPVAEQKILQRRVQAAIDLCWKLLDLTEHKPVLRSRLDEATATQIVWLYNEVTERLGGNVDELMRLHGRLRNNHENQDHQVPSVRVASIDIGGGTTDLMISTYSVPMGEIIRPKQEFRESFKIAGDDILAHLITHVVLPFLSDALKKAGVSDPQALLSRAVGQDWGGQSEQERHLRRLFVSNILEPAALAVLSRYEQIADRSIDRLEPFLIRDILGNDAENNHRSTSYIEQQAAMMGVKGFDITALEITAVVQQVEASISHVMGEVIADLCEAIWAYDCDVLLISGRPSRLRRIIDMITAAMPVSPHRIISMYHYRVGAYYAFRDARNRISDPKTTVVVGAALCLQAEGKLQNFVLRTRELQMYSTARFIGRLEKNGQLRNKNVWLSNVDLDGTPNEDVGFNIPDFENTNLIGFRQLGIERWPAAPLYVLEFGNFPGFDRVNLPLNIRIQRQNIDAEREKEQNDYSDREQFKVVEVTDRNGEQYHPRIVRLRLQTLQNAEGYWRDTGRFTLA